MRHTKTIVPATAFIAVLCILAASHTPSSAQGRIDNPLHTILDLLTDPVSGLSAIKQEVADLESGVASIESEVAAIEDKVGRTARVVVVETKIETKEGTTKGVNIDVAGSFDFDKIKRYTLTIHLNSLVFADAGLDNVSVANGVLSDKTAYGLVVFSEDPATLAQSGGTMLPPYVGTNSFITVARGMDGLGDVDVYVNAYVELEQ